MATATNKTLYSISELSRLSTLDRATVAERLEDVPFTPGAKNAKSYRLEDALPALINGKSPGMDAAKLRKTNAEAELKELELAREQGLVVDVEEVKSYAVDLFTRLRNRVAMQMPRSIAQALYKAENAAQITEILQRELDRTFNDLRSDHQRFL